MQAVSRLEAIEKTAADGVRQGRRFDFIGSPGLMDENPQAFLVDRLFPGATISPHFHDIDQFQIVVDGYCTMGKKAAPPVTFQYADAFTPYGPIVGEEKGFAFFTLRPIASGGFFAMPGNRHNMPCRAGRNIAGHFDRAAPPPAAGESVVAHLMDAQADGVDAIGLRLGPAAELDGPPSDGGGQYYLVCGGDVRMGDKHMPRWSLAHVAGGEASPELTAGPDGADVLVLQFARPSERPGSDPKALASRDPNAYLARPDA